MSARKRASDRRRAAVLMTTSALVTGFIWFNSMLPGETSSEVSGFVLDLIVRLLGEDSLLARFAMKYVRKVGHFVEYFALGATLFCTIAFAGMLSGHNLAHVLSLTLVVAVADESIQVFSGRGPAITDVWIDFAGAVTGIALVALIERVFFVCRRQWAKRR